MVNQRSKTKPKLLYYENLQFQKSVLNYMQEHFDVVSLPSPSDDTDDLLEDIEVLMAPLGFDCDSDKIDLCSRLKIIASSTLSVPHIDKDYAEQKGIKVCFLGNEPDFLATITPTAELTWGLVIALTRRIPWAHKDVCNGKWEGRSYGRKTPKMLSAMSLGIIGLGRLGTLAAEYGKAFGMEVFYYSPSSENRAFKRCSTLYDLAQCADIVSLHAHHTPETDKMINADFFKAMKPGAYFINTARGAIVDEGALLEALETGHIAGASLDVLADEYKPDFTSSLIVSPLVLYAKNHDNLIITPHYGGATIDSWDKAQTKTIELVIDTFMNS